MAIRNVYLDDVLRERWDDETRTVTFWNENGVQTETRPYTPEENAMADLTAEELARMEAAAQQTKLAAAFIAAQAALASDPTTGGTWVQPTAAHDGYAEGSIIEHNGKTWISLTPFNVWEPGVSAWREQVTEGYPAWIQPTGAHDAYPMNARVTHNGQNWENTGSAANTWEPGVFGWIVIP